MGDTKFFSSKKDGKKAAADSGNKKKEQQPEEKKGFGSSWFERKDKQQPQEPKTAPQPAEKAAQQQPPAAPAQQPKQEAPPAYRHGEDSTLDAKIRALVEIISHDKDHAVYPYINYETNKVTFPVLAKIGESEDNLGMLEKLASASIGVLDRQIFERLVLCPDHSDSYAISLRLYCPKCSSLDVEKLHLIEHKACGYIGKKSEFEVAVPAKCPSCRVTIRDPGKELRIPGMWYECNGCRGKFDSPMIKLHCRKYNHDFNMNQAETLVIPFFRLRKHATTAQVNIMSVIPMIKKVLELRDFAVEETAQIKGKSGVMHTTSLYAYSRESKSILVDIRSSDKDVDDAEVISSFVKVIDVSPSFAIFVAIPGISDKARAMSAAYTNINIVTGNSFADIVNSIEQILAKHLPPAPGREAAPSSTAVHPTGPKRID